MNNKWCLLSESLKIWGMESDTEAEYHSRDPTKSKQNTSNCLLPANIIWQINDTLIIKIESIQT